MDRYEAAPLPLSPATQAGEFEDAQLVFYGVEHSGPSFEALVFLNTPEASVETPLELDQGFAGSFTIFGHGGCVGDPGHCDVPGHEKDPFDTRAPHALIGQTKTVDISAALKRVHADGDHLAVTVLAVMPGEKAAELRDVLNFSAMRLVTYA
jgi:hypothetical protein